ncbi:MAG: hypothetical protein HY706_04115 [Candidatus Hydrogenedentes bacterium]|nr:hypothetical protein [Candidatus Hydrogenedentota bacterium]
MKRLMAWVGNLLVALWLLWGTLIYYGRINYHFYDAHRQEVRSVLDRVVGF